MKKLISIPMIFLVLLTACASVNSGSGVSTPIVMTAEVSTVVASGGGSLSTMVPYSTPEPPTPIPPIPSAALSPTELKYKILDQFPDFFFCDPDFYPVARADESDLAQQHFAEIQANQEEFNAILNHNGMSGLSAFTNDQKLLIYREHKRLNAIYFELVGDKYQFQIQTGTGGQQGFVIKGRIDGHGSIDVQQRDPGFPNCPICLAAGTRIDTPRGPVSVEDLQVGDPVWTADEAGHRLSATILKTVRVNVLANHRVVHVVLSDGRELWASSGHPTTDGRLLRDLKAGDVLDGALIVRVDLMPYHQPATYDILPSGETGFYWANGILIGSTLTKP